ILIALLLVAAATSVRAQDVVRTGEIGRRGLTNSDFPRITRLAANVYGYEQVDPTQRIVTLNNPIVVTNQGVLVCDGPGNVENTKRLVADIAMLTTQPIKYVIIGSEHGDHRGGDAAFPPGTIFVAKPQTITLGDTELQVLNIGRAHTGHDLVTYLPREKILFM